MNFVQAVFNPHPAITTVAGTPALRIVWPEFQRWDDAISDGICFTACVVIVVSLGFLWQLYRTHEDRKYRAALERYAEFNFANRIDRISHLYSQDRSRHQ